MVEGTRIARGDVWLVDFGEPVGHEQGFRRPAVVVSADRMNQGRGGLVVVVPCTRTWRGLPTHVEIEPGASGLRETSYAKVEDVKSVSVRRLTTRFGRIDAAELHKIAEVLRRLLVL